MDINDAKLQALNIVIKEFEAMKNDLTYTQNVEVLKQKLESIITNKDVLLDILDGIQTVYINIKYGEFNKQE